MLAVVLLASIAAPLATAKPAIPDYLDKAVNNAARPQSDRDRDINRRPAEVIAFAGIKPGDKIADLMPGGGYFTRIFCAIAGDEGHVYAVTVPRTIPRQTPNQAATPAATPSFEPCTNVTPVTLATRNRPAPELHSDSDDPGWVYEYYQQSPAAENLLLPEPVDVIWTSENYHDLHNPAFGSPDMARVTKSFFAALKPGGILIIQDHTAKAKSGARDTQTLHRIDPELVKREVMSAGFKFVGKSKLLRHKEDTLTTKAHDMHGKSDRFILKFRRP
jgi:predicted methyltransferase